MTDLAAMLAKLRELEGKATKGPWTSGPCFSEKKEGEECWCGVVEDGTDRGVIHYGVVNRQDANLIASARNVMGLLLDVAEAAQIALDELVSAHSNDSYAVDISQADPLRDALSRLAAAKVGP